MQPPGQGLIEAAEQFNGHFGRSDGSAVAGQLARGLRILSDLLYLRMHREVEEKVGADSVLMPVSEPKTEAAAKRQMGLFQVAVSAEVVRQRNYLPDDGRYVSWLGDLLGLTLDDDAARRIAEYRARGPDKRRLRFTDVLARDLPESRRAPLVLFRLFPAAVGIATALAFSDRALAEQLRGEQLQVLPAISDCRQCQGQVLDSERTCEQCGNPLWGYRWLTAAD